MVTGPHQEPILGRLIRTKDTPGALVTKELIRRQELCVRGGVKDQILE